MRFAAALLAALMLLVGTVSAFAENEWIDLDAKGSISLTLRNQDKSAVGGGEITLIQVASVVADDGDLSFEYTNGFEDCGMSLENLTSSLAATLESKISSSAVKKTKTVGSDGKVSFSDLELGLYLVVQTKAASGYNAVSSFLVTVPMHEDGQYIYSVDASPKVETVSKATPTPSPTTPSDSNLPQTGQLDWPIPVLAATGLLLVLIGMMLKKGKKAA